MSNKFSVTEIMNNVAVNGSVDIRTSKGHNIKRLVITRSSIGSVILCKNNETGIKRVSIEAAIRLVHEMLPIISEVK